MPDPGIGICRRRWHARRQVIALWHPAGHSSSSPEYGETVAVGDLSVRLVPAGHVLGSVQVVLEYAGVCVGVSRDYKRRRVMVMLRRAGYNAPIFLHGFLLDMCELYRTQGVDLGPLRPATAAARNELAGQIVLAPQSALADRGRPNCG
jgi:hypothetical protein